MPAATEIFRESTRPDWGIFMLVPMVEYFSSSKPVASFPKTRENKSSFGQFSGLRVIWA